MIETDILVIGAGPAGSTAAKHAALGGADVILIDKKSEIGTPKRCAEGVYDRGLKWLGIEPNQRWISRRINGGTIVAPNGTRLTLDESILPEKGYILERKVFDKFMAMDAARAGAKVMVKTMAKDIRKESDVVEEKSTSRFGSLTKGFKKQSNANNEYFIVSCEQMDNIIEIKAKIIIAADGPESHIARMVGINSTTKAKDMMSGVQYEMVGVDCERMDLLELHIGSFAKGGYAWIFPKGEDSANIGIGVSSKEETPAIDVLNRFIESYPPIHNAKAVEINVGGDPIGGMIEKIYDDNFLVCGDAAGQVNPLTGGGIIMGMLGGMSAGIVAAKALEEEDVSSKRLKEYEDLFKEKSHDLIPKLSAVRDVYESLSDDDLNQIITSFGEMDYKNMPPKEMAKQFIKSNPRLTMKFSRLYKVLF